MKELSVEEKAKAYDELKVKAQELTEDGYIDKLALLDLFPELKESEDEKIRKDILAFIKGVLGDGKKQATPYTQDIPKWYAWLEKRGEQKPVDNKMLCNPDKCIYVQEYREKQKPAWSEEDELVINGLISICDEAKRHASHAKYTYLEGLKSWLNSFKNRVVPQSKQEWSEEKEKDLFNTAKYLREYAERCVQGEYSKIEIFSLADRIESFRPQSHWKPSDEQMKALWDSIPEDVKEISEREMLLNELYKDLKKL